MTNEKALKIICDGLDDMSIDYTDDEQREAFDVAIKALKSVPKYRKKYKRFKRKYLELKMEKRYKEWLETH